MHALIIEDEPFIALLIEDQLRAHGFASVDFAVTEPEAIAAAHGRCPDLITCDVRLQQGCGIAAIEAICATKAIPVLFVTSIPLGVQARVQGALVVAKPFAPDDLGRAIRALGLGCPETKPAIPRVAG